MTDITDLYEQAIQTFADHVQAVRADQWMLPTPCTDWDVRALVNHVTVENLWVPPMLAGQTIAEVGDAFDGDVLGADPVSTCDKAAHFAVQAIKEPGAMTRTVHLSFGDFAGREYTHQLFADMIIHGWDLAHAIGAPEHVNSELLTACAGWFADKEALYRSAGAIGPRVDIPADADSQTRLLAAFGRST